MTEKKRRNRRRLASGLAAALVLTAAPFAAQAAETSSDYLQSYEAEEDCLKLYLDRLDDELLPAKTDFTVTIGGIAVPVTDISDSQKIPVTYYCLVDVSGSIRAAQLAQEKEALQAICQGMTEGDSMVIGTLGNDVETTEPLTDKTEILEAIEAMETGREDTNLYAAIVNSLRVLENSAAPNRKKCLVILSDGADYQKTGYTKEEAAEAVKNASVPVYTLAALPSGASDEQLGYAKELGSFARMSAGGEDFMPSEDGTDGAYVGEAIVTDMHQGVILTLDCSGLRELAGQRDELLLRIAWQALDGSVWENTCYVYAEDLIFTEPESETETEAGEADSTAAPAETETGTEAISDGGSGKGALLAAGGAAVFLLILLAAVIGTRKRKNSVSPGRAAGEQKADGEVGQHQADGEAGLDRTDGTAGQDRTDPGRAGTSGEALCADCYVEKPEPEAAAPVHRIGMAAIGYESVRFSLEVEEDRIYTLGRSEKADRILNPADRKLSAIHCRIRWRNGALDVWDADSTNGTYVNGVPVRSLGMATVENDQTLRLGSYEYRVILEEGPKPIRSQEP